MSHGGQREGAGRKKGASNLLTQELREKINAEKCIQYLQDLVEGNINKASIAERKDAAIALLKKVLPDCKHTEIEHSGPEGGGISHEHSVTFERIWGDLDEKTKQAIYNALLASSNGEPENHS